MKHLLKHSDKVFSSAAIMLYALVATHICNLLFSVLVIRNISTSDIATVTFYTSSISIVSILFFSLNTVINQRVAYIAAKEGIDESIHFYWSIFKKSMSLGLICAFLWIAFSPVTRDFFKLPDYWAVIAFTPIIIGGAYNHMLQGFFRGVFRFGIVGLLILSDGLFRLIFGLIFLKMGSGQLVYLSIPLSILCSLFIAFVVSRRSELYNKLSPPIHSYRFPRKFFVAAILAVFTTNTFISVDVLLSKHYLDSSSAGIYGYLSIMGNMIYFFGSLLSGFIVSIVSRDSGLKKSTKRNFYYILFGTSILTIGAYIAVVTVGPYILPIVFGDRIQLIFPHLSKYGLSTALFSIANVFVGYHLAKKEYFFTYLSVFFALLMITLITFFHSTIGDIINSVLITSSLYLFTLLSFHLFNNFVSKQTS